MPAEPHHTALLLAGVSAFLLPTGAAARPQPIDQVRVAAGNTPLPHGDYAATARFLLNANDVVGALGAWRQAAVAEPGSVTILNGIAACYDRLGRHDLARRYYDEALAIDPQSPLIHGNLGWSLYRQQRDAEAIPWLQRAAGGSDPEIAAVSRRLLTLIAARLRDQAIVAERRSVVAAMAAPSARIELAANGEARLVTSPEAPPAELVARLGDDAALTVAPRAWSADNRPAAPLQTASRSAASAPRDSEPRAPQSATATLAVARPGAAPVPLALSTTPAVASTARARRTERRDDAADRGSATLATIRLPGAGRASLSAGPRLRPTLAGAGPVLAARAATAKDIGVRKTTPAPLPADRHPGLAALAWTPPARPAPLAALTLAWSLFGRFDADGAAIPALSRLAQGWAALQPAPPLRRTAVAPAPAMMFDRMRRQLARMT